MVTTTGRQPTKWRPQEQRFGGRLADIQAATKDLIMLIRGRP